MLPYLAVSDANDIDNGYSNSAMCGLDSCKWAFVSADECLACRDTVTIGDLLPDFATQVRERSTQCAEKTHHITPSGAKAGKRCMVNEIVGQKFLRHRFIAARLKLFDKSVDNVDRSRHSERIQ